MHGRLAQEQLTNPIQKQIMSQGSITGVGEESPNS